MKKDFVFKICVLFAITTLFAYAGTGGSEVNSWYADISNALKGTWGKILAVAFLGLTIILFKGGAIIAGIFMMLIGLGIGTIPDIVDAKYTALMFEVSSNNIFEAFQSYFYALASEIY